MKTKVILFVTFLIISTLQLNLHLVKAEASNDEVLAATNASDVSSDVNTTAASNSTNPKADAKEATIIKE